MESAGVANKIMKKKCLKSDFKKIVFKLKTNDRRDKMFLLTSKFRSQGVVAPATGLYTCIRSCKKLYKIRLQKDFLKLVSNDQSDKRFLLTSKFCPLGLFVPELRLYTLIKS